MSAYIFHITKKETWAKALAKNLYDYCTLKTDGFIHCSTEKQYLEVSHRIFKGQNGLVLLKINVELVDKKIIYENLEGGSTSYPHIYGALNINAVEKAKDLILDQDGKFLPIHW